MEHPDIDLIKVSFRCEETKKKKNQTREHPKEKRDPHNVSKRRPRRHTPRQGQSSICFSIER